MKPTARLGLLATLLLPLSFLPVPAEAQTSAEFEMVKRVDERFRLDLGGFFQQFTTTVRLDSESRGMGTEVNLEDDLGLKGRQANFRADGYWRFGRHAQLDFSTGTGRRRGRSTGAFRSGTTSSTPARPSTPVSPSMPASSPIRIPS